MPVLFVRIEEREINWELAKGTNKINLIKIFDTHLIM